MKIVCESCGAKYSIADEKVAGKVFKIRCKRCSEVIVVRGDQTEGEQAASGPSTPPAAQDEAVWHVVINGEQQGPYAPPQLADMLASGTIDWEAFVWTEGFDNWVALRNVDDLVAKISGSTEAPATQEALQATTAAGGFGMMQSAPEDYAGEPSMGADPFADDESAPAEQEEHNLFAEASAAAVAPLTGGGASASPPGNAPRASTPEAKLTGARNENSVLFSLKNLQALATGAEDPAGVAASSPAGFASGEGSGLIDIRALASAATNPPQPQSDNDESTKDELLSLAGQGSAFGGLGSPMMAPPPQESGSDNKSMIYASIIGAGVLVAAAVVLVGMLNRPDPQTAAAALPVTPATPAAAASAAPPAAENKAAAAPKEEELSEGELAARAAAAETAEARNAEEDAEDEDDDEARASARQRKNHGAGPARRKAARRAAAGAAENDRDKERASAPERTETAAAQPRRKSGANSTIDDLLEGALSGGGARRSPAKKTAPAAADSNLPEKPSRDQVMTAMNGVKSAVSDCGKGASGVAFANVTVAGTTGRVTNATIEGQTGEVGSCIARAVRKARFPRFKAPSFKVKFPFRL